MPSACFNVHAIKQACSNVHAIKQACSNAHAIKQACFNATHAAIKALTSSPRCGAS